MESKEKEGSQRSLSGSPGPAAAAIKGEEALAARRPQLVIEGIAAQLC
jgi:hypothetical protein